MMKIIPVFVFIAALAMIYFGRKEPAWWLSGAFFLGVAIIDFLVVD